MSRAFEKLRHEVRSDAPDFVSFFVGLAPRRLHCLPPCEQWELILADADAVEGTCQVRVREEEIYPTEILWRGSVQVLFDIQGVNNVQVVSR